MARVHKNCHFTKNCGAIKYVFLYDVPSRDDKNTKFINKYIIINTLKCEDVSAIAQQVSQR